MMQRFFSLLFCVIILFSQSCRKDNDDFRGEVKLAYLQWTSEIASSHVAGAIIEENLGVKCRLMPFSESGMWDAVASGRADFILSAWLPASHENYLSEARTRVEVVRKNLEHLRIGLVVPSYIPLKSLRDITFNQSKFNNTVYGIDHGSGANSMVVRMFEDYGITNMKLSEGDSRSVVDALHKSIRGKSWIVVVGWEPHWMFTRWKLRFLDDPKGSFGEDEYIATVVRKGFKKDYPDVYSFLEKFYWNLKDIERVMLLINESESDPAETVKIWLNRNRDKVNLWLNFEKKLK